jgi:hypothetical protein
MTRPALGLAAAAALIGLLVALPTPHRPAATNPVLAGHTKPTTGPGSSGATVTRVWPHAHTFGFPALLPDGSTFNPITIVDPDLAIGGIADPANTRYTLATITPTGTLRALTTFPAADGASVDAIATTATDVYWMQTLTDAAGAGHTTLWSAPKAAGPAHQLTTDVGNALFAHSGYDLQIVGDRLYWITAPHGDGHPTQLRSIPLAGGRVATRQLPGDYVLTAWPWLTTSPGATGSRAQLINLTTGAHSTVPADNGQMITCTPAWCRMIADNAQETNRIELTHPDGTNRQHLGDASSSALSDDVALRGRFEVLANPAPTSSPTIVIERIDLYDLIARRSVVLTPAASDAGARGDYVWWSTGDNETLAWHALDLRSLN